MKKRAVKIIVFTLLACMLFPSVSVYAAEPNQRSLPEITINYDGPIETIRLSPNGSKSQKDTVRQYGNVNYDGIYWGRVYVDFEIIYPGNSNVPKYNKVLRQGTIYANGNVGCEIESKSYSFSSDYKKCTATIKFGLYVYHPQKGWTRVGYANIKYTFTCPTS